MSQFFLKQLDTTVHEYLEMAKLKRPPWMTAKIKNKWDSLVHAVLLALTPRKSSGLSQKRFLHILSDQVRVQQGPGRSTFQIVLHLYVLPVTLDVVGAGTSDWILKVQAVVDRQVPVHMQANGFECPSAVGYRGRSRRTNCWMIGSRIAASGRSTGTRQPHRPAVPTSIAL